MTIRDIIIAFGYKVDKKSEKQVNDSIEKLKSVASKALGAIAVVFSIKGLASLAEAASNAEALDSHFSQVFGNIEQQAASTMSAIADETGVAAGRMKGSFTQIAAFAKVTGMDTESALNLTDRAMRAVADSAAFYDKSLEDVTHSLQSFLKGNFANDAALGLSATETTRNAAAMALYGKSFKDLVEDQKQLTLLKMVEDANKLSGAMGQAARESDTWGNQLGNLKQNLADLKTASGGIILKPMIQALKIGSLLVGKLTEAVKELTKEGSLLNRTGEKLTNWLKRAQVWLERVINKVGGAKNALKLLTIAAGAILLALNTDKILGFFKLLSGALSGARLKVLGVAAIFALLFLAVDDFINFMQGNDSVLGVILEKWGIDADGFRKTVLETWDKIKTNLAKAWKFLKTTAKEAFTAVKEWFVGLFARLEENGAIDNFKTAFEKAGDAIGKVFTAVQTIISALTGTTGEAADTVQPFIAWLIGEALPGAIGLASDIIGALADLITWLGKVGALKPLIIGIVTAFLAYKAAVIATGIAHNALEFGKLVAGAAKAVKAFVLLTAAKIKDKAETLYLIGLYAKDYAIAAGKTIESIAKQAAGWVANTAAMVASKAAMVASVVAQKAVTAAQWLMNAAMSANPIGLVIAAIVALIAIFIALWKNNEGFRNFFIGMWDGIKSFFGGIADWFKGAIDAVGATFTAAGELIKNAWQAVTDFFQSAAQTIIGFFEPFIEAIQRIFGGVIDFFTGVFSGDFSKAWDGIKNIFGGIADWFKAIIDKIIGFFQPLIDVFSGIGSWIASLFGGGGKKEVKVDVQAEPPKTGDLPKYSKGTSNAADTAIVGENGPELVTGLKGAKVFTADKTRDILDGLTAFARGAYASTETAQASNTRNINITQNVTIDNTFNGDKAGQKQSSAAMGRAAQDTTAELARGLAYAR